MLIATLLVFAVDDAKAALDRFASMMRKTPAMSVDVQVQLENYSLVGKGQFLFSKPSKAQIKMDWGPHSYEFVANGNHRIEIDLAEKLYLEYLDSGSMLPPGEVSMTPIYAYPAYFLAGDLRSVAPVGTKFKADRKIVQGSSLITPVTAIFDLPDGKHKVTAYVDQSGKLTSFKTEIDGADGHRGWTVSFSNYKFGSPSSNFKTDPPLGFSPDRVQTPAYALEMGTPFPWKDWKNASSGASLSQLKGKPVMAVFVRPNCEPSKFAMKELTSLSATLSKSGVQIVLLVEGGRTAAQKYPAKFSKYYAGSATAQPALQLPGSPTFFLVDKQGKLSRLWFGFDRERPKQFSSDMAAAAKEIQ